MNAQNWHVDDGIAVLQRPFMDPVRYTKESLEIALANVKRQRDYYKTHEAWAEQVMKFEEGAAVMENYEAAQRRRLLTMTPDNPAH